MSNSLELFLSKKPLYYEKIDYKFFPYIYQKYKNSWILYGKVIHIIGTNGKGTTGKTLSTYLTNMGYKVGHYSSPEFLRYDDIWTINDKFIEKNQLNQTHDILQNILSSDELEKISRFEYTTLMAFKLFENLDFIIFEAGLGGEKDATNIPNKSLSVVTTIGLDHQEFLGDTIKDIATTKLNSINNPMVMGFQENKELKQICKQILKSKNIKLNLYDDILTVDEFNKIKNFYSNYPDFLIRNIALAICVIKILGFKIDISHLSNLKFKGRFEKIAPNIIVDVGHNELSAKNIVKNIKKDTIVIFNCFKNKNYQKILDILSTKVNTIYLIDTKDKRVFETDDLKEKIKGFDIKMFEKNFQIDKDKNYLVYGSFVVVKTFLKWWRPQKDLNLCL